ncbi:hypothetical protein [Rhizobium sp. BR 315]|jgi:hypothetical protein|uniref:hypothetical protein n=1 Tax=Rhizobium sp. BR 315 TaxID=3040014 RepID=UPI003D3447CE
MPKYKRLSDDNLSLAIDRTQAAIEGQKLIVAKLIAGAAGFQDAPEHRQLADTHRLMREILELDLKAMEAEWQRRR